MALHLLGNDPKQIPKCLALELTGSMFDALIL